MTGSRINGTVSNTVTLGSANYGSPLTVTATGVVAPTGDGAVGIYSDLQGGVLTNRGMVSGGYGSGGFGNATSGGAGVDFAVAGRINNFGQIIGGSTYYGAAGGAGVDLANGGTLTNVGSIGGGFDYFGAAGGDGVDATHAGQINNFGHITGGATYFDGGHAGAGIDLAAGGSITNVGGVAGGSGYGGGGIGIMLAGSATLSNSGSVTGGNGSNVFYNGASGGAGLSSGLGASVMNDGAITGGNGADGYYFAHHGGNGGNGGDGIDASGGRLVNHGTITGGNAGSGSGYFGAGGAGGTGANISGTTVLVNDGTITGGIAGSGGRYSGYGPSGIGVGLETGASLTNAGTISGASKSSYGGVGVSAAGAAISNRGLITGGSASTATNIPDGHGGGTGGVGVALSGGAHMANAGMITGGYGIGFAGAYSYGVNGGAGVTLDGAHLVNTGAIAGGAGGANGGTYYAGGAGGAGVYLNGGVLTNAGTIAGGVGGMAAGGNGAMGDAVQFGTIASTLMVDPGAVFVGNVVANAAVKDVLDLAGTAPGTLSLLGTQFTGFSEITVSSGASWTLTGGNIVASATSLPLSGSLSVTGSLIDTGHTTIGGGGELLASGSGTVQIAGVGLTGGELNANSGATLVVGGSLAGAQAGLITIDKGATVGGYGLLDGPQSRGVVDNGSIVAIGGTLALGAAVSGGGSITLHEGSALFVHGAVSAASLSFAAGGNELLLIETTGSVSSTISGFGAGDAIDVQRGVSSLNFAAGTLTLYHGQSVIETLQFAGNYTTGNFNLSSDGHGGADITFVAAGGADFLPPDLTGHLPIGAMPGGEFGTWRDALQIGGAQGWPVIGHALF